MDSYRSGGQTERGQALVLIALSLVGLVALMSLAIDGGQIYTQRRASQNAADGAVLAGGYRLRIQSQVTGNIIAGQSELLQVIHQAAEAHGVPDTDGQPGNSVNGNVTAYYTDSHGQRVDTCHVGSCSSLSRNPWGLDITVRKPYNTYLAGVIGWNRAQVGARAIAVVHAGAIGQGNKYWAIFGEDRLSCGGDAVDVSGSTTDIVGNAHSNVDFKLTGARAATDGQITYVRNCQHCRSNPSPAMVPDRINIEYPNFEAYRSLAINNAPPTQTFNRNVQLCVTCLDGLILGTPLTPITYINGDLSVTGNDVIMTGLIFVTGDVRFSGLRTSGSFTIVTDRSIDMVGSSKDFQGRPFEDITGTYPMLARGVNVALFYTNGSGSNACNTPIIKISGSTNIVTGSIMAPNGKIDFSGSQNRVNGSVLGNSVNISGSNNRVEYNGAYFPPQPDRIELLE